MTFGTNASVHERLQLWDGKLVPIGSIAVHSLERKLLPYDNRTSLALRHFICFPTDRAGIRTICTFIAIFPACINLREAFLATTSGGIDRIRVLR